MCQAFIGGIRLHSNVLLVARCFVIALFRVQGCLCAAFFVVAASLCSLYMQCTALGNPTWDNLGPFKLLYKKAAEVGWHQRHHTPILSPSRGE
jgi:hypothetical protein